MVSYNPITWVTPKSGPKLIGLTASDRAWKVRFLAFRFAWSWLWMRVSQEWNWAYMDETLPEKVTLLQPAGSSAVVPLSEQSDGIKVRGWAAVRRTSEQLPATLTCLTLHYAKLIKVPQVSYFKCQHTKTSSATATKRFRAEQQVTRAGRSAAAASISSGKVAHTITAFFSADVWGLEDWHVAAPKRNLFFFFFYSFMVHFLDEQSCFLLISQTFKHMAFYPY